MEMIPIRAILHHSLTRDSGTVSWGAIRNYHVNHNGWSDIGYHFGIENLRGQTEIVCGRMPDKRGVHCRGHNRNSIGICFVDNFDLAPPSEEKWNAGVKLVKYLIKIYNIQDVKGHREYNSRKSCPGKFFDLDKFRKEVGLSN